MAVPDNHHGVIGILVEELKAQDLVKGQRPLQLGHADPDMVHPFDVDRHLYLPASASRHVGRQKPAPFALFALPTMPKRNLRYKRTRAVSNRDDGPCAGASATVTG